MRTVAHRPPSFAASPVKTRWGAGLLSAPFRRLIHFVAASVLVSPLCGLLPSGLPGAQPLGTVGVPQFGAGTGAGTGTGTLYCVLPSGRAPLPCVSMEAQLSVSGVLVLGEVRQRFHNPLEEPIEVLYVFPLPERATVRHMEMLIGGRRILAQVRERTEAQQVYAHAKRTGRRAALLDQDRPNLFRLSAANVGPGETIEILLRYVEELIPHDGEYQVALPLTFTPRFIPTVQGDGCEWPIPQGEAAARHAAAAVPDAGRITPPFLRSEDPRGVMVSVKAVLESLVPVRDLESPSHAVHISEEPRGYRIALEQERVPADRDFILRWRLAPGRQVQSAIYSETLGETRYGMLMVVPPVAGASGARLPTETLFVIDVSGSMQGPSIEQAREALLAALDRLQVGDRYDIMSFAGRSELFRRTFAEAGDRTMLQAARTWVRGLEADGVTMMLPALQRAVAMLSGSASSETGGERQQRIVLLTDGAVGNEMEICAEVLACLGPARLHVLSIGRAPNGYLARRLADLGGGLVEFVSDLPEAEQRIARFLERIDRPVLTDLRLSGGGLEEATLYPARLPDLFSGEPLICYFECPADTARDARSDTDPEPIFDHGGPGKPNGAPPVHVQLSGRAGAGTIHLTLPLARESCAAGAIATRCVRARIDRLMGTLLEGASEDRVRARVVPLAVQHNLLTRFTSMVAVEETPSATGLCRSVRMPNTLPDGSHLLGLPRGGAGAPLHALAGLLFGVLGLSLLCFWHVGRRR